MKIELKEDQTGYEVIGEYIGRFWKHYNNQDIVICRIGSSYDGIKYYYRNEIAMPCCFEDIEFLYDWWEGENYLDLKGICYLKDIEPYGGIFDEAGVEITCANRGKYGSCTLELEKPCFEYETWERKE